MTVKVDRYGWIPDLPDQRDFLYSAPLEVQTTLPPSIDLRPVCPPIYDQGQLGSCTANAIAAALEFDLMKDKLSPTFTPSRLYIYFNQRVIAGTINCDNGAGLRDGMKVVAAQGICPEDQWPYDIANWEEQPPDASYQEAIVHNAIIYKRLIQDLTQMKGCLASGYPFIFGFTVYKSFEAPEVAQVGHVSMPVHDERALGGHSVLAVGYGRCSSMVYCAKFLGNCLGNAGLFHNALC